MIDYSKFLVASDKPSDKVAAELSDNFTAIARYGVSVPRRTQATPIPHGLDTESVPDGFWSSDNVTWYPMGVTPPNTSGAQPVFQTTEVDAYADETNLYVYCSNYTASDVTIYFAVRLMARK